MPGFHGLCINSSNRLHPDFPRFPASLLEAIAFSTSLLKQDPASKRRNGRAGKIEKRKGAKNDSVNSEPEAQREPPCFLRTCRIRAIRAQVCFERRTNGRRPRLGRPPGSGSPAPGTEKHLEGLSGPFKGSVIRSPLRVPLRDPL